MSELPDVNVVHCADAHDFLASLPDESVDMIFTDPPYHRDGIPLYGLVFAQAARLLKPGRLALVYGGSAWLPDILKQVPPDLTWFWAFVLRHGGHWNKYWARLLVCSSKLVLAFSKGKPRLLHWVPADFQERGGRKANHPWEQNLGFPLRYIRGFTEEGELVLDPLTGSGTTAVACKMLNRNFLGCEILQQYADVANDRLRAAEQGLTLAQYRAGQKSLWQDYE